MDAKQTALENAMRKIEKDFGKGAIMRLGDIADKMNMEVISSGSLAVDLAVGVGGYPRGRVIEIYGPESSGKTTLALHAIASAQKSGGIAPLKGRMPPLLFIALSSGSGGAVNLAAPV